MASGSPLSLDTTRSPTGTPLTDPIRVASRAHARVRGRSLTGRAKAWLPRDSAPFGFGSIKGTGGVPSRVTSSQPEPLHRIVSRGRGPSGASRSEPDDEVQDLMNLAIERPKQFCKAFCAALLTPPKGWRARARRKGLWDDGTPRKRQPRPLT